MAARSIQKRMGTEELNALRCGTCKMRRMSGTCMLTAYPVELTQMACISHSAITGKNAPPIEETTDN